MIIPLGQEESGVRRHPVVTYGLMLVCLVVFLATHPPNMEMQERAQRQLKDAFSYYMDHPYLELSPEHSKLFFGVGGDGAEPMPEELGLLEDFVEQPENPGERAAEQQRLEDMIGGALDIIKDMPVRKYGLIPSSMTFIGLIGHMFLHGGWIHLLGNMFLLFICGPFLEDVWGRPLYGAFYIAAGLFSGIAFSLHFPASELPLIGASGAIAGVMGAFAIRHWNKKMRFFYLFFIFLFFRYGTFSAPAWLMLPLWFFGELFSATMTHDMFATGAGGVAYWAHVWGFVFGVGAAVLMWQLKLEHTYIAKALDKKETIYENPELEEADRALEEGRPDDAWALLAGRHADNPRDIDAALALWSLALRVGRAEDGAAAMQSAIREEVQTGDCGTAYLHWQELKDKVPGAVMASDVGARMILGLLKCDLAEEARDLAPAVAEHLSASLAPGILIRLAALPHSPLRERAAALAVEHPEVPDAAKAELKGLLVELPPAPIDHGSRDVHRQAKEAAETARAPEPKKIKLYPAVPLELKDGSLIVDVTGQGRRSLAGKMIKALSAARIGELEDPPALIDLWFDDPCGDGPLLRGMRFDLGLFDPATLFPAAASGPGTAFENFMDRLKSLSGAPLVPDPEKRLDGPYPCWHSIAEYEREISSLEK